MTISETTNWSWTNDCPKPNASVVAEMPMEVGERYSLLPIVFDFPESQKNLGVTIKRVDVIGQNIFILEELFKQDGQIPNIYLTLKMPYDRIDRTAFRAYHYIIANGLMSHSDLDYECLRFIKSESDYQPESYEIPKRDLPEPGVCSVEALVDKKDEVAEISRYKIWSSGKCEIM